MSLQAALTDAQLAALTASAAYALAVALPAAEAPRCVYLATPEGNSAKPPLTVLGEDQWLDDSDDCLEAYEVFSTVHHWARTGDLDASQAMARAMAAAARAVLATELTLAGGVVVEALHEETRFQTDPDGSTHAVQTFRYLVEASA